MVRPGVLLVCSERSGSNLLKAMLNQHEALFVGPPMPLYECFSAIEESYGDLSIEENWQKMLGDAAELIAVNHQPVPYSISAMEMCEAEHGARRGWPGLVCAAYSLLAEKSGAQIYGYKYSTNMLNLRRFIEATEFTHIIYQVRDPRDVLISHLHTGFNQKSPREIASTWQNEQLYAMDAIKASGLPLVSISYEDLVLKPRETMNAIWQFLELSPCNSVEDYYQEDVNRQAAGKSHMWQNLSQPLQQQNVGRYYREWNFFAVKRLEWQLAEALDNHGYEKSRFKKFDSLFRKPSRKVLSEADRSFQLPQKAKWESLVAEADRRMRGDG